MSLNTRSGQAYWIAFCWKRATWVLVTCTLFLGTPIPCMAQQSVDRLVAQLGDASFLVRERAATELLSQGDVNVEALKSLQAGLPRESRERVALIVRELEQRSLAVVTQRFMLDDDQQNSHGLPGWQAYFQVVGGSRSAKILFLEMVQQQNPLARQIERVDSLKRQRQESEEAQRQLARLAGLQANSLMQRFQRHGTIQVGDCIGLMLAVSVLDLPVPMEVSEVIRSTSQLGFAGYLNRQGFRPCLLQLLSQWVPKSPEAMAPEVMGIAYYLDLPSVLPIARSHLSRSFDAFTREQAILCLSKFGQAEDVDRLLQLADDPTVIHKFLELIGDDGQITESFGAPPGTKQLDAVIASPAQMMVRVNDLAVAVAMLLSKEDPKQLFPNFVAEKFSSGWRSAVAVSEDQLDSRNQAIRTWTSTRSSVESVPPAVSPVPDPNS